MSKLNKALDLLNEYYDIKDELLSYTEEYHDAMLFDWEGYNESLSEDGVEDFDTDSLERVVIAHRGLLKALKDVEWLGYTYC